MDEMSAGHLQAEDAPRPYLILSLVYKLFKNSMDEMSAGYPQVAALPGLISYLYLFTNYLKTQRTK